MNYPKGYEWLGRIGTLPKLVTEGLALYGVTEDVGSANDPTIMAWAKETGMDREGYSADAVPWCGLYMAIVAKRAGYDFPKHPLWALNWQGFGQQVHQPLLGSVLIFVRTGGGHVGLYIGESKTAYAVLGGNTSDRVGIAFIDKKRLVGAREPAYKIGRPASAKPYIISQSGALSTNEA